MASQFPIGNLQFKNIVINPYDVANACRDFLIHGSKKNVISVSDLTIVSDQQTQPPAFVDLAMAMKHGTKFFDAVAYFSMPHNARPKILVADNVDLPDARGMNDVAEALFYQLFHVMVRGTPNSANNENGQIPGFLKNVRGLKEMPAVYANRICSFDLMKIDWRFIRLLPWNEISQEATNRLGLGLAGYRMLSPFKHYPADKTLTAAEENAIKIAITMATAPADWAIHAVTRSADFIQQFGNLNANLKNLITRAYSAETIEMMVVNKLLYERPTFDARHQQFLSWPQEIVLSDPIFPTGEE